MQDLLVTLATSFIGAYLAIRVCLLLASCRESGSVSMVSPANTRFTRRSGKATLMYDTAFKSYSTPTNLRSTPS